MVVALGPGKFYGSSLPRPRFFYDVKLNDERVDPPAPIFDPLLSWANEAHWSMGGLSFQRRRLQGRIEGSIKKLRVQRDRSRRTMKADAKTRSSGVKPASLKTLDSDSSESSEEIAPVTPSPPPKKKSARKLMDEFERVAAEEKGRRSVGNDEISSVSPKKIKNEEAVVGVSSRSRSRRSPAVNKESTGGGTTTAVRRTSPRKLKA